MISLKEPDAPYTLDLAYGIQVTVKPLTTSGMLVAQAAARRRVERDRSAPQEQQGGRGEETQETDDDTNGLFQLYLLQELGLRHIIGWQGVEQNGKAAVMTPENIKAVLELYPIGEKFLSEFTLKQMLLNAAKNASGLSAAGITNPAEGPTIAKAATTDAPARKDALTTDTPPKQ